MRNCSRCQESKPPEAFYDDPKRPWCKECFRENNRANYQKNKAARVAYARAYRERNAEKCAEWARDYRKRNPQAYKKWYIENRSLCSVKWARRRGCKKIEFVDLESKLKKQGNSCYFCKRRLVKRWHTDHLTPISRGGHHTKANVVIVCQSCNQSKFTKTEDEFSPSSTSPAGR